VGIFIILFRGFNLLLRKKLFNQNWIILFPFFSIMGLLIPIPFLLNQSFLNLGDFTFVNILLAVVIGVLPLTMIFGILKMRKSKTSSIDAIGTLFILQWMAVLFYWSIILLSLWS